VFAPSTTPTYSNIAFQILAYALESITGKKFKDMLETDLISKLQLNGTTYAQPVNSARGVIPGTLESSGWNFDIGEQTPFVLLSPSLRFANWK
jgi:CubicO group peptidase (beta-lactamase class C family)